MGGAQREAWSCGVYAVGWVLGLGPPTTALKWAGEAGPTRLNLLRQALPAPSSLPVSLPAESVPVEGRRI